MKFPPKDIPLRRDVHALGDLLGEVLRAQEGHELFEQVERARMAARSRREGRKGAADQLDAELTGLDPENASAVVRAFSAYFGLVNMAERVHRIRRRRDYLRADAPQPGSLRHVIRSMRNRGVTSGELEEALQRLRFAPVFTAHPTEATRRTLLQKEQRIARSLVDRIDLGRMLPQEDAAALARVKHEVNLAWQTDEYADRPRVIDEVDHVTFFLANVLYRIIPAFYRELKEAVEESYGKELAEKLPHQMVQFGSWVGGDMDGNPNVGPATIRGALAHHRSLALSQYRTELEELFEHLSQSEDRVTVHPDVNKRIEKYDTQYGARSSGLSPGYRSMPYRKLLWLMLERLQRTYDDRPLAYEGPHELIEDLEVICRSIEASGTRAGSYRVRRMMERVHTFGFHLATLDIRQDSLVHRQAVGQALGREDFVDLPADERVQVLHTALGKVPSKPNAPEDSPLGRSLAVMETIGECRKTYGPNAIGPYIISMAQGPDDTLAVLLLAELAGLTDANGSVDLDVTPLFETVDDLENGRATLHRLLDDPVYKEHLRSRGYLQRIMLGYSDSSKESGMLASRWALYRAQEELLEEGKSATPPVRVTFFHGRGGTIGRGGSKPRRGILAEPKDAIHDGLRLTEQGEIIAFKYGLRDIALRTLELNVGALLERTTEDDAELPNPWRNAMNLAAKEARQAYRDLIFHTPEFLDYFRTATPIDVIERLAIGSRPSNRRGKPSMDNLRAIPWVFSWVQSRHLLPGWWGAGAGLRAVVDTFGLDFARHLATHWRFFANLVADVEMVLAKADLGISERYAALAGNAGQTIYPRIKEAFDSTCETICAIQEATALLDRDPVLRRAIRLRNPYVDPMSIVQVDLLRRWRATDREDDTLLAGLMTTVRGIARGMQNTG